MYVCMYVCMCILYIIVCMCCIVLCYHSMYVVLVAAKLAQMLVVLQLFYRKKPRVRGEGL